MSIKHFIFASTHNHLSGKEEVADGGVVCRSTWEGQSEVNSVDKSVGSGEDENGGGLGL